MLREQGQVGEVRTVVVLSGNRKLVRCFGQFIRPERIFYLLNLSIGQTAIRYLGFERLISYHRGYFVPMAEFEPEQEDHWVALVNISVSAESGILTAIPYPRRRPVA